MDFPPLSNWFSGTAIFLAGSFTFGVVVGLIGIRSMISDRVYWIFLVAAMVRGLLAWYTAAKQERDSAELKTQHRQNSRINRKVNPNQSAQALADDIIARLNPIKKEVEQTTQKVDRIDKSAPRS